MDLTHYRSLGRSGLLVSPLALGAMTFGTERWGTDATASRAVFDAYVEAKRSCGQSVKGLTRERLEAILDKQREGLRERFGEKARFRFRVVVEEGQVKLKASKA